MIEALVTVVLLSVSLLGLAMLQAQGFKFATGSYVRTQANLLAQDIIDKMRLNPGGAAAYTAGDPGGTCSATMASVENDLNCWYRDVASALSGGGGTITQNGTQFTVTVNWSDQAVRTGGADPKQLSLTVEL